MARIVDKDTRLIDIDFGPYLTVASRDPGTNEPVTVNNALNGTLQTLYFAPATQPLAGSFVQYQMIDLSFMTMNNEVMQPTDISVQRTSPVPLGFMNNGNEMDQIEEYIYIFTRPLNNELWNGAIPPQFEDLRSLGLDRSETRTTNSLGGIGSGIPTHEQTVYAEKRMYSYSSNIGLTEGNGGLIAGNPDFNNMYGMPILDNVTTWGTMSALTGPSLYCYRIVITRTQQFSNASQSARNFVGETSLKFPPVNITFLCKDPKYTEGEYLTRLANAMNNIPEGGPTA